MMQTQDDIPDDLDFNPTVSSLTALIGEELIFSLSQQLAGRRIYIPRKPGSNCPLAVAIGLDAALKISHVYGGSAFDVPVAAGMHSQIIKLHEAECNNVEIAARLKTTRRTVQKVIAKYRERKQMDLFD